MGVDTLPQFLGRAYGKAVAGNADGSAIRLVVDAPPDSQSSADRIDPTATQAVPFLDDYGSPTLDSTGQVMLRPVGMDPHFFVRQALLAELVDESLAASASIAANPLPREYARLANFKQGGLWDAQRIGGQRHTEFREYSTVAIGLYGAARKIPIADMLFIENLYASVNSILSIKKKVKPTVI